MGEDIFPLADSAIMIHKLLIFSNFSVMSTCSPHELDAFPLIGNSSVNASLRIKYYVIGILPINENISNSVLLPVLIYKTTSTKGDNTCKICLI